MPTNNRFEIHSNEMQDIMGRIPGWTIRWGLLMIAALFIGIAVACYFIKYPRLVTSPIQLTTYNPPIDLMSKSSNKITKFFVANGDTIQAGAPVLLLESNTSYDDVHLISHKIIDSKKEWEELVYEPAAYGDYQLGDLQSVFLQYQRRSALFRNYLETSLPQKKKALLKIQIQNQQQQLIQQNEQLKLLLQEYELAAKDHTRDSIMVKADGLSLADYERSTQTILQKRSSIIGFRSSITSTETSIVSMQESLIEVEIQMATELKNYYLELNEAREQLKTQISNWKTTYLITSPISGKIAISKFWIEHQFVTNAEKVGTVIPFDGQIIMGKAFVPHSGFAKVELGQTVNVKLDSYPYMEYGFIRGTVHSISPVPEESGYAVEILFPNELISSYGKKLEYIHQMSGTADIITKDMRLIEQFIQPIRAVIDNLSK